MSDRIKLDEYKQQIADLYSNRSANYDSGDWHPRIASRLIEHTQLSLGQQVLDIATGTGMVAIEAAQIVSSQGKVIGVDISTGMLDRARQKAEVLGLDNLDFQLADAEKLNFPENTFDYIFCSSAFIWMFDLLGALQLWYRFLKPGGILAFHAFADTAFIAGIVAQKVLEKYGVSLLLSKPTGTIEQCYNLLQQAGFEEIDIRSEQDGNYISLEQAKAMWLGNGSSPTPGQHPNPLLQLTSDRLTQAKLEFDLELEALQSDRGIWNDITIFYTFGRKH
jgi:ubiquinone/menaquinone biosynthesis C-methylase UbiE